MCCSIFLPSDINLVILSKLSAADILKKCLSVDKGWREQAIIALFSRFDDEALACQKTFLQAWRAHSVHFDWLKDSLPVAKALQASMNNVRMDQRTRLLVLEWQATRKAYEVHLATGYAVLVEAAECRELFADLGHKAFRIRLRACREAEHFLSVCSDEHALMLMSKIQACLYDANDDVRSAARKIVVGQWPRFQQVHIAKYIAEFMRLLEIGELLVRLKVCAIITDLAPLLSADEVARLLPAIRIILQDDNIQLTKTALQSYTALLTRCPSSISDVQLKSIVALFNEGSSELREQAFDMIPHLATHLSEAQLGMMLSEIRRSHYYYTNGVVPRVLDALLRKLPNAFVGEFQQSTIDLLEHGNSATKKKICKIIADIAVNFSQAQHRIWLEQIYKCLSDTQETVRIAAKNTFIALLKTVHQAQPEEEPKIIKCLLEDEHPDVREQAYWMLVELVSGWCLESVQTLLPVVSQSLTDSEGNVLKAAALGFNTLFLRLPEPLREEHFQQLLLLLEHERSEVREQTCNLIIELAPCLSEVYSRRLLPSIKKRLYDDNENIQFTALNTLHAIVTPFFDSWIEEMHCLLQHEHAEVRLLACKMIADHAPVCSFDCIESFLPAISNCLQKQQDNPENMTDDVLLAYGALLKRLTNTTCDPLLQPIVVLLEHENWRIRQITCQILADLASGFSEQSLPIWLSEIQKRYDDEDEDVSEAALQWHDALLERFATHSRDAHLSLILGLLEHTNGELREQACVMISKFAEVWDIEHARLLLPEISKRFEDGYGEVVITASRAFVALLKRFPEELHDEYLEAIVLLLGNKELGSGGTACQMIIKLFPHFNEKQVETVLPKLPACMQDEVEANCSVAVEAFVMLFLTLPPTKQCIYLALLKQSLTQPAPAHLHRPVYRCLCLLAQAISKGDLGTFIPVLIKGFDSSSALTDVCTILKIYAGKLGHQDGDSAARRVLQGYLMECFTSTEKPIREAALEVASFPAMLAHWSEEYMPQDDLPELWRLRQMMALYRLGVQEPTENIDQKIAIGI